MEANKTATPTGATHTATPCKQLLHTHQYSSRNHSFAFECPTCGKTKRQNINFLGRRRLFCDGSKFTAVSQ